MSVIKSETKSKVLRYGAIQKHITQNFFEEGIHQLAKINKLFEHVQMGMVFEGAYDCLPNPGDVDSYAMGSVFCYTFCEPAFDPKKSSSYDMI